MAKILIVVDMQNDFVTGALGTPEAQAIVPNVVKKMNEYRESGRRVLCTMDCHSRECYMNSLEGKHLPVPHCLYGTEGMDFIPELPFVAPDNRFRKDTFAYRDWKSFLENEDDSVELCGVCSDICVIANALAIKAEFKNLEVYVDASCCAGTTPERHKAAMEVMKSCQINVTGENDG